MKFLPNFEGFRHTPFYAPIFLTKDVLYLLSHISKWIISCLQSKQLINYKRFTEKSQYFHASVLKFVPKN